MKIILTYHALMRLNKRNIMEEEIIEAVKYPDIVIKKHYRYYYRKRLERGKIEIVCEKTERNIKILTIYWV